MDRSGTQQKLFTRRALLFGGVQLGLFGVLGARLYDLQVLKADKYRVLADENRMSMRLLPPRRGEIYDRFGLKLATNRSNNRVLMIADQTDDARATLTALQEILPLNDDQIGQVLKKLKKNRSFVPVTIAENLTWSQFARLNAQLINFAGVVPDVGEVRYYPFGESNAHIVGYVSAVSEHDLTGDPVLELPGFRIGKGGIEQQHDKTLRGKAGDRRIEVNAYGREIRELERHEAQTGNDVVTTIDANLQAATYLRLQDESAAAVIMDVHGGEILSLASTPGFDPNAFNFGISAKAWRDLIRNPRAPLTNKAVAGVYPPGSTFKMMVAIAALEAGIITTGERVFCNGVYKYGDGRFHCWRAKYGGHGHVDMHKAIEQSCDVYFYEVARRLGIDKIAETARRFGFGQAFDLGLKGVNPGLMPTKDWKLAVHGERWVGGETLVAGIGQGYVLASPLQLAVMTARLGNGGVAVEPRLVRGVYGADGSGADRQSTPASMGIAESSLKPVLAAMDAVVNSKRGTARRVKLEEDFGRMSGKTGTAQVRRITKAERRAGVKKNKDRPWEHRDHALFVALAPVEAPKYAISVIVEHGGSGGYAAGIASDLMRETLLRDPVSRPAVDGPNVGSQRNVTARSDRG